MYRSNHHPDQLVNLLILTDGYTDSLDCTGVKGNVLVLSTGVECPTVQGGSKKLRQVVIDKSEDN